MNRTHRVKIVVRLALAVAILAIALAMLLLPQTNSQAEAALAGQCNFRFGPCLQSCENEKTDAEQACTGKPQAQYLLCLSIAANDYEWCVTQCELDHCILIY